jgi:hypothetical protein
MTGRSFFRDKSTGSDSSSDSSAGPAPTSGTVNHNRLPRPRSLSTPIVPPCAWTITEAVQTNALGVAGSLLRGAFGQAADSTCEVQRAAHRIRGPLAAHERRLVAGERRRDRDRRRREQQAHREAHHESPAEEPSEVRSDRLPRDRGRRPCRVENVRSSRHLLPPWLRISPGQRGEARERKGNPDDQFGREKGRQRGVQAPEL